MPQDLIDDKSTLVQVMAWCRQATNHYLSQCWTRSLSPYGVTRPQWVNSLGPSDAYCVGKLNSIGSDHGLLPVQHQAIIWTNAGIFLIGSLGTNFSEILIKIKHFHWKKYFETVISKKSAILILSRLFMWIKILCIEYILWGIHTIESTFDVANMVKMATVKDVPINNDALLNIQAC